MCTFEGSVWKCLYVCFKNLFCLDCDTITLRLQSLRIVAQSSAGLMEGQQSLLYGASVAAFAPAVVVSLVQKCPQKPTTVTGTRMVLLLEGKVLVIHINAVGSGMELHTVILDPTSGSSWSNTRSCT